MWLFVGLGNPGDEYSKHRHNIGFMALDEIARHYGFPSARLKYQGQLTEGRIDNEKVILLKPQTYMNNSGQSVQAAAKFYKIAPERIVVFHDELDVEAGKVRVKKGGGNAGHNGLRSMQAHLGTPDFWRVRLGIGHPGSKERVHGYVLSDFAKAEQTWLTPLLDRVTQHAGLIVKNDLSTFASKVGMDSAAVPAKGARAKE